MGGFVRLGIASGPTCRAPRPASTWTKVISARFQGLSGPHSPGVRSRSDGSWRCAAARPRTPGRPGLSQQLPRQDRRMRWPVVYPLICDADPTDRSVRRSAVLRRRHQSRLITAIHGPPPSAELSRGCHQRAIRPSRSRVAPGGLHVTQRTLHGCARTPPAVRCQLAQQ